MKFVAVPRADNVHVIVVESLAEITAILPDQVDHLRHAKAFTGGSALVWAEIAISIVFPGVTDDADLDGSDLDQPHAAIGNLAFLAHQQLSHVLGGPFVQRTHIMPACSIRVDLIGVHPAPAPRSPPSP